MKLKSLAFLLVLCMFAAGTAFAQLTPKGQIMGKVVDAQGEALPGVSIEANSPRLVGKAVTISDVNGVYRLMALPSGTFEIVFTLSGFKTLVRQGIVLELSQTLTVNVALDQASVERQVTVIGQSPLIDVKSTTKGQTMSKEIFMTLPRGRNFDSLISTIPGVQNEGITAGLSVDGASGAENMWYADGADIGDFHYGDRGQSMVLELLDEVKVTASGYNAEFGGSLGGVVNVITKSGSNTFHADIIGYYDNNRTWMQGKSRDFLESDPYQSYVWRYVNYDDLFYNGGKDRDKYDRFEGVFGFGGPIIKDKLWFYGDVQPDLQFDGRPAGLREEGRGPSKASPRRTMAWADRSGSRPPRPRASGSRPATSTASPSTGGAFPESTASAPRRRRGRMSVSTTRTRAPR